MEKAVLARRLTVAALCVSPIRTVGSFCACALEIIRSKAAKTNRRII